jgi:lysozyme
MQSRSASNIKIIDVSHHQNTIDWPKVKAAGIQGAFVKATEGVGYTDPQFRSNAVGSVAAGIEVGFYHYAHPENNDPKAEAAHFAATVNGIPSKLPLILDVEGEASKIGAAALTKWCATFLQELERLTGHAVMIYTGGSFAKTYLGKELAKWPLWIAHYGVDKPMSNSTWGTWSAFQYTSSGKIDGITGNVDVNVMEKDVFERYTKPVAPDQVTAIIFGTKIKGAKLEDGVIMLPLRAVSDAIGGKVSWDQETLIARIDK